MNTEYTPGPWKKNRKSTPVGLAKYEVQYGEHAENICDHVYQEEDANLIAAAPDLLEALEVCVEKLWHTNKAAIEQARVAIAKARGKEVA